MRAHHLYVAIRTGRKLCDVVAQHFAHRRRAQLFGIPKQFLWGIVRSLASTKPSYQKTAHRALLAAVCFFVNDMGNRSNQNRFKSLLARIA